MAIASLELQRAIYGALSDGEYDVYEVIPSYAEAPYIVIGEENLTPNNTKTNDRWTFNKTIHTWTKGSSSMDSKTLNYFVIEQLLNNDLNVNGFYVDFITLELLTTLKEQDIESTLFHGVLQFEITLTKMEV